MNNFEKHVPKSGKKFNKPKMMLFWQWNMEQSLIKWKTGNRSQAITNKLFIANGKDGSTIWDVGFFLSLFVVEIQSGEKWCDDDDYQHFKWHKQIFNEASHSTDFYFFRCEGDFDGACDLVFISLSSNSH